MLVYANFPEELAASIFRVVQEEFKFQTNLLFICDIFWTTLKVEAASFFVTFVPFHQSTGRHNLDDCNFTNIAKRTSNKTQIILECKGGIGMSKKST
jgi:hypothetical protein